MDPTELRVYVGGADGRIYASLLYRATRSGTFQGPRQGSVESGISPDTQGISFIGHKDGITSLSLSFDGMLLVSGSKDASAMVWDTNSGQSLRLFPHHKGISFCP